MASHASYERQPVASQWCRAWRPLPERPSQGSCITACRYASRAWHFYNFTSEQLEWEKYRFFGKAAEGCVDCLRHFYNENPHLINATSSDGKYTALDYAIWEAQKHPDDPAFDAVLEFLVQEGCRSNYYRKKNVHNEDASTTRSSSGSYSGRVPSP
jgi:hypothetical protein